MRAFQLWTQNNTLIIALLVAGCHPVGATQKISETSLNFESPTPSASPSASPSANVGHASFPFDEIPYSPSHRLESHLELPFRLSSYDFDFARNTHTSIDKIFSHYMSFFKSPTLLRGTSFFSDLDECFSDSVRFITRVKGFDYTDPRQEIDQAACTEIINAELDAILDRYALMVKFEVEGIQSDLNSISVYELSQQMSDLSYEGRNWRVEFKLSSTHLFDFRSDAQYIFTRKYFQQIAQLDDQPCWIEFKNGKYLHSACVEMFTSIDLDEEFIEKSRFSARFESKGQTSDIDQDHVVAESGIEVIGPDLKVSIEVDQRDKTFISQIVHQEEVLRVSKAKELSWAYKDSPVTRSSCGIPAASYRSATESNVVELFHQNMSTDSLWRRYTPYHYDFLLSESGVIQNYFGAQDGYCYQVSPAVKMHLLGQGLSISVPMRLISTKTSGQLISDLISPDQDFAVTEQSFSSFIEP